jgi:UDP-glucose 4-epimerase
MEPGDYAAFPEFQEDSAARKWNLWGYIDARDAARAVRAALDWDGTGSEAINIAAADTVMDRPTAQLLEEFYSEVEVRGDVSGNRSLTDIRKAERLLGWVPTHSWRDSSESTR